MKSVGRYTIVRPSIDRQLAMDALAAIPAGHPMIALLEVDVTRASQVVVALQAQGVRVSLFAFLVRSIAAAISDHPAVNTVFHGRKMIRFEDVDINIPMEVESEGTKVPRQIVLRRAQDKSAPEIFDALDRARQRHDSVGSLGDEDRAARRTTGLMRWVPSFLRILILRRLIQDAFVVKRSSGTTLITSIGKATHVPGFAFTFSTGPRAAAFVIGSVAERPWNHEGQIVLRQIQSLTVMLNHDIIDGSPAARFVERLREVIESAEGLDKS